MRRLSATFVMSVLFLTPAVALDSYETLPPGSYYRSCQACVYQDGYLECNCRRVDQSWTYSRLPYRRICPGDTVQNIDGVLRCD